MIANRFPAELLAKGGPMVELMPKIKKAAMSTVIKAVLTLIQDETRNGKKKNYPFYAPARYFFGNFFLRSHIIIHSSSVTRATK